MTITEDSIEFEFPALKEAQAHFDAKAKELGDIFAEAGPTIDLSKVKNLGDSAAVAAKIRDLNSELTDLGKARDGLVEVARAANAAKGRQDPARAPETGDGAKGKRREEEAKSLGEMFVGSKAFKAKGASDFLDIDIKTLFERTAGWGPESVRSGRVVLSAQRPVQVTDLLPAIPTSQAAYKYMEETTFTNNAAEKAEGSTYGEAALALTERSAPIEKVTVWLPMTDEQLEDEPGARAYVNARLPFMLEQRVDGQILVGDGTPPNLQGILDVSTIQTQAKGADPVPDAVYKAMTKVRVTGRAMPNATVFHPNDWQDIRLLRTSDGIYIWGSPSEAGPERIWGLQVVQSDAETENTGLVGDFANFSLLVIRRGLDVQVSNSHSTYFVEGKQAIRADVRLAAVWLRPTAFASVTGI